MSKRIMENATRLLINNSIEVSSADLVKEHVARNMNVNSQSIHASVKRKFDKIQVKENYQLLEEGRRMACSSTTMTHKREW